MPTIPLNLPNFGFVEREKVHGAYVKNRCGRDFLYYALHYYYPQEFNPEHNNPQIIESTGLFGISVPASLAWMQIQFMRLPKLLQSKGLSLTINDRHINSFTTFVRAMLCSRMTYSEATQRVEEGVQNGHAVGLDIAMAFGGLLDHVLFVYGFDDEFYYVFDTRKVPLISYEKVDETRDEYFMKISKTEVQKRWKRWSRVWEVVKESH